MNTFYKRYLFALILLLGFNEMFAQNHEDALRYTQDQINGSARFTAMGGAFSSLGGDLSALSLNPAGITTFSTNRLSGTFSYFNKNDQSSYFSGKQNSKYHSFDDNILNIDQLGIVWVYKSDVSNWNKLAFAFNYNRTADYGNYVKVIGENTTGNSVMNYFLDNAQGIPLSDIKLGTDEDIDYVYQWLGENKSFQAQQAFLGYQAYIINPSDPNDDNNTNYVANASYNTVKHFNKINTNGNKGIAEFTFGGTYMKKLQLGVGLSLISINYKENNSILENGYNPTSELQSLKFNNFLRVEGSGVQLKLGGIYKFDNKLRLSFAFLSPQWLEINEYLKQSVYTEFNGYSPVDVAPDVENSFAPYKIITPSKITAGLSKVFNKKALISVDYSYQDYSNLHFKEKNSDADTEYFDEINQYMTENFQPVHSLNIGAEFRLKDLSLRAGSFMSTSPFKNSNDLYAQKGYSLGMGYNFGGIIMDMAWQHSQTTQSRTLTGLSNQASIDNAKNKLLIGIRYDF